MRRFGRYDLVSLIRLDQIGASHPTVWSPCSAFGPDQMFEV